jgi:hypothetical protein
MCGALNDLLAATGPHPFTGTLRQPLEEALDTSWNSLGVGCRGAQIEAREVLYAGIRPIPMFEERRYEQGPE